MNLSEAQKKVLSVIHHAQTGKNRLRFLGPGYIGGQVWGTKHRKPQAYARTAGKVLHALKAEGLVSYDFKRDSFNRGYDSMGWNITTEGIKVMEDLNRGKEAKNAKGNDRVPE